MEIFNATYEPFLLILLGATFLVTAFFSKSKHLGLEQTGEVVEGIIFECEEVTFDSGNRSIHSNKPSATVRFVTKTKEWITEPITWDNISVSYTGQFKEGQKVTIIYDPKNPKDFIVKQNVSRSVTKLISGIIGAGLLIVGLYKLLSS